jgi:hypothetical protein
MYARMVGELRLSHPDVIMPEGVHKLIGMVLSPDGPAVLPEIRQYIISAGVPPLNQNEEVVCSVPINHWWSEGEVICEQRAWEPVFSMMPWMLQGPSGKLCVYPSLYYNYYGFLMHPQRPGSHQSVHQQWSRAG